jgi:hypothetical protein
MEEVDRLVEALRKAPWKEREAVKAQLIALAQGEDGASVRDHLEAAKRGELLEVQWEIEEVIEATAPKQGVQPPKPPEPEPTPAEAPQDPNRPLTHKDLVLVYDDPRGLRLFKSKVGERWFAMQVDPRTGQPQTFELHPQEVAQVRQQFAGSPYWVLGAGGLTSPAPAKPTGPQ